jgi:hypothetical protein
LLGNRPSGSWNQIPAESHRRVSPLKEDADSADFLTVAAHDLPDFDPRVLERSAEAAYRRANAIFTGCVAGGVVVGAMFGATPLTPIGAHWPIPQAFGFATMLLGALLGGVVGYVVGDTRSALCRLQGQTALAQVEGARNARAMAEAMREIHEIHQQLRGLATPAPVAPAPRQPEPERPAEPSPFNLPSVPPLRVATGGLPDVKPPPVSS